MNPYEAPKQTSEAKYEAAPVGKTLVLGRHCDFCGSCNTGEDRLSRVPPNPIFMLLFGWIFMLIKAAFSKKTDLCRDCGQVNIYKSTASKIALVVLIAMVAIVALTLLGEA